MTVSHLMRGMPVHIRHTEKLQGVTHLIQSVKKWGLSACTMTTSKKSLQFFPTMCVIPLSLHTDNKHKCNRAQRCLSLYQDRVYYCRRRFYQVAHTYTKLKGLLVMRKSFFPLLANRCKTASVSSPLRMNLSVKRRKTTSNWTAGVCVAGRRQNRKTWKEFLPRSSIIHLYMYPLRWTMPTASCGLNANECFSQYVQKIQDIFDPYYEISLNYSHSGRKTPIIWKWLMTCQFAYFQRRNCDEVVGVLCNWKPFHPRTKRKSCYCSSLYHRESIANFSGAQQIPERAADEARNTDTVKNPISLCSRGMSYRVRPDFETDNKTYHNSQRCLWRGELDHTRCRLWWRSHWPQPRESSQEWRRYPWTASPLVPVGEKKIQVNVWCSHDDILTLFCLKTKQTNKHFMCLLKCFQQFQN